MAFTARWAAAVAVLSVGLPVSAKPIVESFTSPVAVTNGTLLGQCKQLRAALFGGGGVTVAGNGHASVSTPVETDAAMLHSAAPLPAAGYKVSVEVTKINYTQYAIENGVTLLAIANTVPLPASEGWWSNHRMLGVEVDTMPGSPNKHPIYVNYWDSANMYTWNGTQWGVGDPAWQPVLTFDPVKTYTVEIVKTNNTYTIRVLSGAKVLTQATVPVPGVRPATKEYLVVGDRLTNYFKGTMQINAITMPAPPGCSVTKDAGPPTPDAAPPDGPTPPEDLASPEATAPDTSKPPEAGVDLAEDLGPSDAGAKDTQHGEDGGAVTDGSSTGDGGVPSWDLYTPDVGPMEPVSSDCDCSLGPPAGAAGPPPLLALLLLIALRRRRG